MAAYMQIQTLATWLKINNTIFEKHVYLINCSVHTYIVIHSDCQ